MVFPIFCVRFSQESEYEPIPLFPLLHSLRGLRCLPSFFLCAHSLIMHHLLNLLFRWFVKATISSCFSSSTSSLWQRSTICNYSFSCAWNSQPWTWITMMMVIKSNLKSLFTLWEEIIRQFAPHVFFSSCLQSLFSLLFLLWFFPFEHSLWLPPLSLLVPLRSLFLLSLFPIEIYAFSQVHLLYVFTSSLHFCMFPLSFISCSWCYYECGTWKRCIARFLPGPKVKDMVEQTACFP